MRITKATPEQRAAYNGLYPLHGFVTIPVAGGEPVACPVEDLRGHWSRENPQWEVMAPKGFIFVAEGTHSLLGFTQRDVLDRITELDPED